MDKISDLILPSVLATQALATMGTDPVWDARVAAYLAAATLARAYAEWGPYARINEEQASCRYQLKIKYGQDYANHPEAAGMVDALRKAALANADLLVESYAPWWRAGCELVSTPAPTIGAAVFKALLIEQNELWNDNGMEGDCFAIVGEDFARLLGGA